MKVIEPAIPSIKSMRLPSQLCNYCYKINKEYATGVPNVVVMRTARVLPSKKPSIFQMIVNKKNMQIHTTPCGDVAK